jgi:hypothetical protein
MSVNCPRCRQRLQGLHRMEKPAKIVARPKLAIVRTRRAELDALHSRARNSPPTPPQPPKQIRSHRLQTFVNACRSATPRWARRRSRRFSKKVTAYSTVPGTVHVPGKKTPGEPGHTRDTRYAGRLGRFRCLDFSWTHIPGIATS